MDGAIKTNRMFPSYTTEQLKEAIAEGVTDVRTKEHLDKIKKEVEARENGVSKVFKTPQL